MKWTFCPFGFLRSFGAQASKLGVRRFPVWRGCSNVTMRNNPLIAVDVHNVIGSQVLHVHECQCRDKRLAVTQMLVVLDNLCLDVLAMQASPSSPSGQGHGSTARLPCFAPWRSSLQGQSEQVRAALRIPQGQRNALFAFSLKLNFLVFPRLAFYLRGFCVNSPNSVFCYILFP